MSGDVALYFK